MAFKFHLSSGLFSLPAGAASVDWAAVNNSPSKQDIQVTVFQGPGGGPKTIITPGPVTMTIDPGAVVHNANFVGPTGPFLPGMYYEVAIDTNDRRVLPMVSVWADHEGTTIPGTLISSRDFLHLVDP